MDLRINNYCWDYFAEWIKRIESVTCISREKCAKCFQIFGQEQKEDKRGEDSRMMGGKGSNW